MLSEYRIPGQLVLLPGMGLHPEPFFANQRRAFGDRLITPAWSPDLTRYSISVYADKLADDLRPQLSPDLPVVVAGFSLGGLVALELAPKLEAKAVLLIGSLLSADEVPSRTLVTQKLAGLVPNTLLEKVLGITGLAGAQIDGLGDDDTGRLRESFSHTSPEEIRWGLETLAGWQGPSNPAALPPVHRIHGKQDWVFPPHPSATYDVLLEDGRHVLPLSHEISVNRFLRDHCRHYMTQPQLAGAAV